MTTLKERLRADLTANLKARNELETTVLRGVIGAIQSAEKAGKEAKDFGDVEVQALLTKEVKKRRDTAAEYRAVVERGGLDAQRRVHLVKQTNREDAEAEVISAYLPEALSEGALSDIIDRAISESGAQSPRDMGKVMKLVQPQVAGRADGRVVADLVKARLN